MVRFFENIREEEIVIMMKKFEKVSFFFLLVNLSEFFFNMINNVICRIVMGRKYSLEENFMDFGNLLRIFMEFLGVFLVGDYIRGLVWIDKICGLDCKMKDVSRMFMEFLEGVV